MASSANSSATPWWDKLCEKIGLVVSSEMLAQALLRSNSTVGMVAGSLAEFLFVEVVLPSIPGLTVVRKPDCHDPNDKGDIVIHYREHELRLSGAEEESEELHLEVKSLQGPSVKLSDDGEHRGNVQVRGSDTKDRTLPTGETVRTCCLVVEDCGWDILVCNLLAFGEGLMFAYIRKSDLPLTTSTRIKKKYRKHLLQTSVEIKLPLEKPFYGDLKVLLDEIIDEMLEAAV